MNKALSILWLCTSALQGLTAFAHIAGGSSVVTITVDVLAAIAALAASIFFWMARNA